VENAERSLKDTQARERAGVGTKFDVLQSEVQLANAKQELFNAEAAQLVARRDLARLINYPATIEITAADRAEPVKPWELPLEETILLAVRNRAELDIRRLEREVARDRANTALARIGPQVSLFANVNTASEFTSGTGIGTGYQLGARLDWNLYDGGRASAQVNQFKVDQAIAETQFEQAARQARFDVESAYINQRSRLQQIETATKAVQQAEEALRLARLRLEAGVGTQLEVITAESDLTRADVNRVQAIIGYNQSRASLERAVSGL
jgi:OMF family outer membrane factor